MKGYFIKVGDKEIGPFTSEAAAKAEAKALKEQDYDVKLVSKSVSETTWLDYIGHAERDIELENDDDDDDEFAWLKELDNDDDDDDDTEDVDDDDDDDDDSGIDWDAVFSDNDDDANDDDDEDSAPGGQHFYFKPRAKSK